MSDASRPGGGPPADRLDSWKEIAGYLGRGVTTVQRWERDEQLPVHRHHHAARGSVYAWRAEIDAWRRQRCDVQTSSEEEASTPEATPGGAPRAPARPPGSSAEALSVHPSAEARAFPRGRRLWGLAAGALVLLALAATVLVSGTRPPPLVATLSPGPLVPRPLMSEAHLKAYPRLSPDGRSVAFLWWRDSEPPGIFLISADGGAPRRLTSVPAGQTGYDLDPAWSADGQTIAFLREHRALERDLLLIPAGGGRERLVTTIRGFDLTWAPDNQALVVADRPAAGEPFAIVRIALPDGARRQLTRPAPGLLGDRHPSFSPDGRWLAFARVASEGEADLYVAPASGGEARRLTTDRRAIRGLAWLPDGSGVAFASQRSGGLSLWATGLASDATPVPLVTAGLEGGIRHPSFARRGAAGAALAFATETRDVNIWRARIDGLPEGTTVVRSDGRDDQPAVSRTGRLAYLSDRSGTTELWLADADGRGERQLSRHTGAPLQGPSWSPDETGIAVSASVGGQRDLYVVPVDGGPWRRVTDDPAEDRWPSWSPDGATLFYSSTRSGRPRVWAVPATGGPARPITTGDATQHAVSADGRWLYFVRGAGEAGLWRVPIEGGVETPVEPGVREGYWAMARDGVVYVGRPPADWYGHVELWRHSISTGRRVSLGRLPCNHGEMEWGLAAAPDGTAVFWTRFDTLRSGVMVVDALQPVLPPPAGGATAGG